jgi:aminoglycoside phosphotransferase (APT) family kinase protein
MAPDIDPALSQWALARIAPGGSLVRARHVRDGEAQWLLTVRAADGAGSAGQGSAGHERDVVLRVGPAGDPTDIRAEAASLAYAAENDLPAPRVLGIRDDSDPALLLVERVQGSSEIPLGQSSPRLRALGGFAARLARLKPPSTFEPLTREISSADFAALRTAGAPQPLLDRAQMIVSAHTPTFRESFVHGDLWQGNAMWVGDDLIAVIDWDYAGRGPAGIDLGSLRLDAAMCFGRGGEIDVLDGWQQVGGKALNVAYWDLVAVLSTLPDLDWFVDRARARGRRDLTPEIMRSRRNEFLKRALRNIN